MNIKKLKINTFPKQKTKLCAGILTGVCFLSMSSCGQKEASEPITFDAGQHRIVEINRDLSLFLGANGSYCLTPPPGYELLDYDYDKDKNFEYHDCVYVNTSSVATDSYDQFGTPQKILSK